MARRAAAAPGGRSAETVYGGHEHALRQTVLALTAGSSLDDHENPGEATVQVLRGRIRLTACEVTWEGRSGDLLVVPDSRHAMEALEDSAVLLTVSKARPLTGGGALSGPRVLPVPMRSLGDDPR